MRLRHALPVLAVCSLGFAACGGDDSDSGGDAEADIQAVVSKSVSVDDAKVECRETVTTNFINTVYGDVATCERVEADKEEPGTKATGATVSDLTVDGDSAKGKVTIQGGDTAGANGEISFAKEDDAWKVDGLSVAFLRSQLQTGLAKENEEPFDNPEIKSCFGNGLRDLDDDAFREFAYQSIREDDAGEKTVQQIITRCLSQSGSGSGGSSGGTDTTPDSGGSGSGSGGGDASALREKFEEGVERSLKATNAPQALIDCVKDRLRETISDDEILQSIDGKNQDELRKIGEEAGRTCAQRLGPDALGSGGNSGGSS